MINTGSNGFENNDQQAENAESKTADQQNENTVGAEQTENKPVKGIVKSVEDKKVKIVIGEKTYTFENNKDDLKLQKGDKVSVVLVKDAEGKEQVKSSRDRNNRDCSSRDRSSRDCSNNRDCSSP